MVFGKKIYPVISNSFDTFQIDDFVCINNIDDDMHNKKGIYKGNSIDLDGKIVSLIILEENQKNFYTYPELLVKINTLN
tara:strand:+ start:424 stop:660 length:237 start_codon:yes stop_codon:yes gene_type:complete